MADKDRIAGGVSGVAAFLYFKRDEFAHLRSVFSEKCINTKPKQDQITSEKDMHFAETKHRSANKMAALFGLCAAIWSSVIYGELNHPSAVSHDLFLGGLFLTLSFSEIARDISLSLRFNKVLDETWVIEETPEPKKYLKLKTADRSPSLDAKTLPIEVEPR